MSKLCAPLTEAELAAQEIKGWPFGRMDKVRFSELDALNHVNNAVYMSWRETTRIAYILECGLTGMTGAPPDPQIVVRRQSVDYLKPILMDEVYCVAVRTTRVKPSSLVMEYGIFVNGEKRAGAETVIVSLTQDGSARQSWNQVALDKIIARDGATQVGFT